jgi:hypothetical protein
MKYIMVVMAILLLIGCSKERVSDTGKIDTLNTAETSTEITEQSNEECVDSDNGLTKEVAGKVTGTIDGEEYTLYDKCVAGLLIEYFCEDGKYQNQNLRCPEETECLAGACR